MYLITLKPVTMKLSEFFALDEARKKQAILHEGVLVGKRLSAAHFIFLFQLENCYVEAYCNRLSRDIEEYRVFDRLDPLQPYLDELEIDDLLN